MCSLNFFKRLSRYPTGESGTADVWPGEKCHSMAKELTNGQLAGIIRTADKKLVAVDFSNVNCGPCRFAKPWWDSLPVQYPNIIFCTVQCSSCPDDASAHNVTATPTFLFFHNGSEVGRILGLQKSQILAILDKHKGGALFQGFGRSLAGAAPPKPVTSLPTTDFGAWTRDILREMGFPPAKIEAAISATNHGTVDQCVLHLERIQQGATLQTLLDMGYDASVARAAIARVGDSSVEDCILAIEEMAQLHQTPEEAPAAELGRRGEETARERLRQANVEQEAKLAQTQRAEDVRARQQLLQKPPTAREQQEPVRATVASDCTLKLVFDGPAPSSHPIIQKFRADNTLGDVCQYVCANVAGAAKKKIAFETLMPRQRLENDRFGESLSALGLAPRAQLFVKYL
jgi:thiol-disulfide isomerase/thioredoxin